jgi:multicomponent Na+:H+ antiporter subunit D
VEIGSTRKVVVLVMAFLCFIGGILGQEFISFLSNFNITIGLNSYLQKVLVYFITLALGFFVYKWIVIKLKLFAKAREIELSFNDICLSVVIFFGVTTLYLLVKYV